MQPGQRQGLGFLFSGDEFQVSGRQRIGVPGAVCGGIEADAVGVCAGGGNFEENGMRVVAPADFFGGFKIGGEVDILPAHRAEAFFLDFGEGSAGGAVVEALGRFTGFFYDFLLDTVAVGGPDPFAFYGEAFLVGLFDHGFDVGFLEIRESFPAQGSD